MKTRSSVCNVTMGKYPHPDPLPEGEGTGDSQFGNFCTPYRGNNRARLYGRFLILSATMSTASCRALARSSFTMNRS
jgi:hypothetical protein